MDGRSDDRVSSKEVMARTGISRATLNNYIALGILSKPVVRTTAAGRGEAPRLGYFPASAVQTIEKVAQLKREGLSMSSIAQILQSPGQAPGQAPGLVAAGDRPTVAAFPAAPRLTIEDVGQPAYLVNVNFEIEWCNPQMVALLGAPALSSDIRERNMLRLLLESPLGQARGVGELLRLHLSIAKNRLSKEAVAGDPFATAATRARLVGLYDHAALLTSRAVTSTEVDLGREDGPANWQRVHASFFREGVLFVFAPAEDDADALLRVLARRDLVIRDILRRRMPCLTPLAVLVADLQDSVKICSELPPEEYFELVNEVWSAAEPLLRRYYATHGKHVGDGIVYYFFPQPDVSYLNNAVQCALELKAMVAEIDCRWRSRKNWLNRLRLNIGIDEGEEWFGTYQAGSHIEFAVLGDTINRAARLSDFARGGAVWATKNLITKLPPAERARLRFGIRRRGEDGRDLVVPATFGRLMNLLPPGQAMPEKLQDVAALPVTEVLESAEGK